jgi:hypothetical protein
MDSTSLGQKGSKELPAFTAALRWGAGALKDALGTATVARLLVASGAAIATAASVLSFVLLRTPFATEPLELLGSFAYYTDLNIANRLTAVTLFIVISLLSFFGFMAFFSSMKTRENEALLVTACCQLPALFWLSGIVLTPQSGFQTFWLYWSAGLCWFALFAFLRERASTTLAVNPALALVTISLSFFVAPALMVLVRSPLPWKLPLIGDLGHTLDLMSFLAQWLDTLWWLAPLLAVLLWLFWTKRPDTFLGAVLYPVQFSVLLLYCLVLPGAFVFNGTLFRFYRSGPAFWVVVVPLIALGIWDINRRRGSKVLSPVSPFCLLALLFFFFLQESPRASLGPLNLYELGSRLPSFWVSFQGWASLFKDVYITYGLWDYAQFLMAWMFTGQHTAAVYPYGIFLFRALVLTLEFGAVASFLPLGLAFAVCLVAGVGPQSIVLIFMSIMLQRRVVGRPALWIILWILLSAVLPFARIPQGAICVVASLPAFVWQARRLLHEDRVRFWRITGFSGAVVAAMVVWPFGGYFWGLLRILAETARVNSGWAANAWTISTTPLIGVILGNGVLAIPLGSLVAAVIVLRCGRGGSRSFVAFALCSFAILFGLASISYAFSRTDGLPYARQAQVGLILLLPLVAAVMAHVPTAGVRAGALGALLCFAALWPREFTSPIAFLGAGRTIQVLGPVDLQDAAALGMPNLGVGNFPQGYVEEDGALKQALDRVLSPAETFLDLTMNGLHYFSTGRRMVTEYPVYYVYPGDKPQLRAIEALEQHDVAVTLLEPDYYDESPSSLRTYYLYRYALLHGLPWQITPTKTLLIPPEDFSKVGLAPPDPGETLHLLDEQFPQTNFSYLPAVWGRGFRGLASRLRPVRDLSAELPRVGGADPSIELGVRPGIRGDAAGLLILDLDVPPNRERDVLIRWTDSRLPAETNEIQFKALAGTNIVPLDASPRWLLESSITMLTIAAPVPQHEREIAWSTDTSKPPSPLTLAGVENGLFGESGDLLAESNDPYLVYKIPRTLAGQTLLVHIALTAPQGAGIGQLYYRTPEAGYNQQDSEWIPLISGENDIYFSVPAEMSKMDLRFDPGVIAGDYHITTVEAKALRVSSPLRILRAALYQRPNIDNPKSSAIP